jgi:hypothetical protein
MSPVAINQELLPLVSRYGPAEGAPGSAAGSGTTGGARSLVRGVGVCRAPSTKPGLGSEDRRR